MTYKGKLRPEWVAHYSLRFHYDKEIFKSKIIETCLSENHEK